MMKQLSKAHIFSASAVIDPNYCADALKPQPEYSGVPYWHYAAEDLELFFLDRMKREFIAAKRKVGYPGFFRPVENVEIFQHFFDAPQKATVECNGIPEAEWNGEKVMLTQNSGNEHRWSFTVSGAGTVKITVVAEYLPALGSELEWQLASGKAVSRIPEHRSGKLPHLTEVPETELIPCYVAEGDYYDAGCEVFGSIEGEYETMPLLGVGETLYEMRNTDPALDEQDLSLVRTAPGHFRSAHPLAFRYFRLYGADAVKNIRCRLLAEPEQYKGAFAASPKWNRVWMSAACTLRLCMHHFLLDGIKRDHMPWAGDLSLSILANAYTFADGKIVKRTLTALGCSGSRYRDTNGITDYSCWLLISHDLYQLYFDDPEYLVTSWAAIRDRVENLIARTDETGFLVKELQWVFLDWTPGNKFTALQMLFLMALQSGVKLAKRLNQSVEAERWNNIAGKLRSAIRAKALDERSGLYRACPEEYAPDQGIEFTRHAQLLALLSGIAEEKERGALIRALSQDELTSFGTPYMKTLEMLVTSADPERFAADVKRVWEYQLDQGSTTFWEGYDPSAQIASGSRSISSGSGVYRSEKEYCEFYGRPYGASLCHAWASGAAYLFPRILLGLRPVADGWKRFVCKPRTGFGDLYATVPTPYGDIEAEYAGGKLALRYPKEIQWEKE